MHYKSGENTLWGSLFKWWWPLQSSPYQVVEINSKFLLNFTWMGDLSNSLLEPSIFFCSARCINKINCQNHWQKTEETVKSLSVNKLVWIGYKTVVFHLNFLNFFSIYIYRYSLGTLTILSLERNWKLLQRLLEPVVVHFAQIKLKSTVNDFLCYERGFTKQRWPLANLRKTHH